MSLEAVASTRARLWDGGFRPVAICNHDARHPSPGKAPLDDGWQTLARQDPPAASVRTPDRTQLNTGILADGLRAIDIDVDNPTIARSIQNQALLMFGETLMRYRDNSPRVLLVYRAAIGAPPKVSIASDLGKVEVLGRGQQFVAYGYHSSGAELRWMPEAPHEVTLESVSAITEDQVSAFLEACANTLNVKPNARRSEAPHASSGKGLGAEALQIYIAMSGIPNEGAADWETWNRVGMALWAATSGSYTGCMAWHAWSELHPSYNREATQERWDHYAKSPPTHIGAGTLFHMAKAAKPDPFDDPNYLGSLGAPAPRDSVRIDHATAASPTPGTDRPLFFKTFSEAQPHLDVADFVEGVLTQGSMSVVYGESNSGKTFFASDIAMCVAAGMGWRDREVEAGAVLYLALEGGFGISNRIAAFREEHGIDVANVPFAFVTIGMSLLDPDASCQPIIDAVEAVKRMFSAPLRLIVVDTLSRAMAGGNENAPEDMTALVATGDRIREKTEAHVLWIHHSGKDAARGARGHSSLRAATDTEIEITAEGQSRLARVTKQRDMECSGEFAFTLKVVELGQNRRGKTVTSCVVDHGDGQAPSGASVHHRLIGHAKRALEVLTNLIASQGQQHASTPGGVLSVPDKWWRERFYQEAMPGAEPETKKKTFRRAADALVGGHHVSMGMGRVWLSRRSSSDDQINQ